VALPLWRIFAVDHGKLGACRHTCVGARLSAGSLLPRSTRAGGAPRQRRARGWEEEGMGRAGVRATGRARRHEKKWTMEDGDRLRRCTAKVRW
jgi:hypothetical protein